MNGPGFLFGDSSLHVLCIELDNTANTGLVKLVGDELLRHFNQHLLSSLGFTFTFNEFEKILQTLSI